MRDKDYYEEFIRVICRATGVPREEVEAQVERLAEMEQKLDRLRERTSRTPLEGERADQFLDAILPMLYVTPRALMQ